MRAAETPPLQSDGEVLLRRLFDTAASRLQARGISMRYAQSLIEWLLGQPEWRPAFNPLRTLDGRWHQQVGSAIESRLLDGSLRTGNSLVIGMSETPTGPRIEFEITSPA